QRTPGLPPRWRGAAAETRWQTEGGGFARAAHASEGAEWDWLEYQHWACTADERQRGKRAAIRDKDSYNQGGTGRRLNAPADVLLTCRLLATGEGALAFAATAGSQRFAVVIEPARRVVVQADGQTVLELPVRLHFDRGATELEFGLCDRQALLVASGR